MPDFITVTESSEGQRIDNFLVKQLKGVPKSRLYRALRQGEVRVNKHRIKPEYRLQLGDQVRIPPIRGSSKAQPNRPSDWQLKLLEKSIIYEEGGLIIINKPAGIASHGGSGIAFGVIETLRHLHPHARYLELVHRLDRDTSGCLMIAKKRSTLVEIQQLMQAQKIEKMYLTLVQGNWQIKQKIKLPLLKNQLQSGERMVQVSDQGKMAVSLFETVGQGINNSTLVRVTLDTGRTHQIRVQAAHMQHPIAGDEKYGNKEFNKQMRNLGLKRLFLHAASLSFTLPSSGEKVAVCACLDPELLQFTQ